MKFLMLRSKRVAIRRQSFDDVALPVDGLVIMVLDLAVLARWDDGRGSAFCQPVAQGFAVIALVGDEFGGGGMASIQRWATLQSWTFPGSGAGRGACLSHRRQRGAWC